MYSLSLLSTFHPGFLHPFKFIITLFMGRLSFILSDFKISSLASVELVLLFVCLGDIREHYIRHKGLM